MFWCPSYARSKGLVTVPIKFISPGLDDVLFSFFIFIMFSYILWYLQGKFVSEAMSVIAANTDVPVSVKCRIGVDHHDSYNELCKDPASAFLCLSEGKQN